MNAQSYSQGFVLGRRLRILCFILISNTVFQILYFACRFHHTLSCPPYKYLTKDVCWTNIVWADYVVGFCNHKTFLFSERKHKARTTVTMSDSSVRTLFQKLFQGAVYAEENLALCRKARTTSPPWFLVTSAALFYTFFSNFISLLGPSSPSCHRFAIPSPSSRHPLPAADCFL